MQTLQETYQKDIALKLKAEFKIASLMAVPKMVKIVLNTGMGEALKDNKSLEKMTIQLAAISGQKAKITRAKRAISTFKLRAGDAIGLKVTLRGKRMYDFMTKLFNVALPRVRDFRGVPLKGFDGSGNYTLGIKEQSIFPDLDYAMIDKMRGFEITFVTTAKTNDQAKKLLELLGLPFERS